jgi:enoyl-CoA hydratase/carnithine racemase
MTDHIGRQQADGILTLTLNRPEKKNALTDEMYADLATAIDAAQTDPAVRVVVLRSSGDAFTAGNDIAGFARASTSNETQSSGAQGAGHFIRTIAGARKPIVAAVRGLAVGVGTTMLLHCDLVFVTESTKLSAPFINLALVPEAASSLLLPARIGYVRAFEMFATGQPIDGPTAVAWGLANRVVDEAALDEEALRAAQFIASRPPEAVMMTKHLMRDLERIMPQLDKELTAFKERLVSAEAREAFQAFSEKRKPNYPLAVG